MRNHKLDTMKLVFGNRSHGTFLRRGSSILQFTKWYKHQFFALCPFPLSRDLVEVSHMQEHPNSGGHAVAVGGADSFSCGVRITHDFEQVNESSFLEFRTCQMRSRQTYQDGRTAPFGGSRCIDTYSSTTSRSRPHTRGESICG